MRKCVLKNTVNHNDCLVVFVNDNITKEQFDAIVKEDQHIDEIFNRPITKAENYFLGEADLFDTRDTF